MKYGDLPKNLGEIDIKCNEMLFYQYLPVKLVGERRCVYEKRLNWAALLIKKTINDFIKDFGYDKYMESYVYITAKHMYQTPSCSFNRGGYHSDGFLTDDINYVWYDSHPTIFNTSNFNLTLDDAVSMKEMEVQALKENEVTFNNKELLRLNQFNIHKVNDNQHNDMRTFVKISFSKDKYDLIGNAHNYLLDYDWEMVERRVERNIPQAKINLHKPE
jgi:hypothetical protein